MSPGAPLVSIIVPVHNGALVLPRSLAAILVNELERDCWELIVVDDASADDSALVAGRFADTVVKLARRPRGPAYARNRGCELARGDIIVSVDADVCVHPDAIVRMARRLTSDRTLGAVIGAYDTSDLHAGIVTDFRNLRHSHLQRRAAGDVDHFWPACGAVRREVLEQVGHFDEWHYWRPQAEGPELGQRIRRKGYRIVLDPEIQGMHLKEWTLRSSIATDAVNHVVPRMRLLFQGGNIVRARAPSLSTREKVNAALTCMAALLLAAYWAKPGPIIEGLALLAGIGVAVGIAPLVVFLSRARSPVFALACLPLQLLQYLIAGASVVVAWLLHQVVGEPRRDVTDDAFAEVGLETWPPIPRRLAADAWKQPNEGV